jgi:hypothetical protein
VAVLSTVLLGQTAGLAQTAVPMAKDVTFKAPIGWRVVEGAFRNATELIKTAGDQKSPARIAHLLVTTEVRRNHAEALQRLQDISAESKARARVFTVGGWPAIQRQEVVELPRTERGEEDEQAEGQPARNDQKVEKAHPLTPTHGIAVTVAVAAGDRVVRFDGMTASEKDQASADEALRAAQALVTAAKPDPQQTAAELQQLERAIANRTEAPGSGAAAVSVEDKGGRPGPSTTSAAVQVQSGVGELEVAVTNGGNDVVVAANSGWSRSHNGGVLFTSGGPTPGTFPRDGDPSLAVATSGNIYYAFVGYPDGSAGAGGVTGCSDSVARSTDFGNTFPFLAHAVLCPSTGAGLCFPDQEHIGADRLSAGTDQLYVVWRQFTPSGSPPNCRSITTGFVTPSIVCSANGGTVWTPPLAIGTGDRPRVGVGRDGFVYVVYRSGLAILVNKFSSCGSGLVQQVGFPVTVASAAEVACPLAGLDRCNSFGSPTISPDDIDANHLYLGYAINTSASNDNVLVRQSTDSGATWSAPVQVNTAVTGRRFMPWTCAVGGTVQAGWYDRRAASAAAVDLTDYFQGSALVKAGALQTGLESNLTNASDPQCASGWPFGVDSSINSEACNTQPQLAGRCRPPAGMGSNAPCDFSSGPACAVGETCAAIGGAPKYGDYNGIACGFGRVYTAWASATPPAGTAASGSGVRIFSNVSTVPSDFFLRDWTVNATNHDTGTEPSTNPIFYETSDVWIQTTSVPVPFVNDQPPLSEVAQESFGGNGNNYLFVRTSRRAPAAPGVPDASLTVRFLWADFGMGSNFTLLGSPPAVVMHAVDMTAVQPAGFLWHVDPTTSTHVCIAAEIDGPGDATALPHLAGLPAGGTTDSLVKLDNNKAQRNLGVTVTTGAPHLSSSLYAVVHNAETSIRDIVVNFQPSPGFVKNVRGARLGVVGDTATTEVATRGRLVLSGMLPGENRWIGLSYAGATAAKEPLAVRFTENANGRAANGFTIQVKVAPKEELAYLNALLQRSTYTRLGAAFKLPGTDKPAAIAAALLEKAGRVRPEQTGRINAQSYLAAVNDSLPAMRDLQQKLGTARNAKDVFGAAAALEALRKAAAAKNVEDVAVAHSAFLQKLDAWQTRLLKEQGDAADILQTVRWQKALFEKRGGEEGRSIAAASADFLRKFQAAPLGAQDYSSFLRPLMPLLKSATQGGDLLVAVERTLDGSPAALQKAHRDLLLKLQATP